MVLSSLGGLNFYWKEEEAKEAIKENQLGMTDVEFPPTLSMPLDLIRRAEHAMGLDFFDGIIDIEVALRPSRPPPPHLDPVTCFD